MNQDRKGLKGLTDSGKQWIRAVLWILTVLTCVMIFLFSCQDGETSMETSGILAKPLADVIAGLNPEMTQAEYDLLLDNAQAVVRKTAHFSEYALLGCLICLLHLSYGKRHPMIRGTLLGGLNACTDELHQYLSGSRTGMVWDVLLDTCGALAGTAVAVFIILRLVRRRKKRRMGAVINQA